MDEAPHQPQVPVNSEQVRVSIWGLRFLACHLRFCMRSEPLSAPANQKVNTPTAFCVYHPKTPGFGTLASAYMAGILCVS